MLSDKALLLTQLHGTKGIDVDSSSMVFVTTGEIEPLAFFDLAAILEKCENQKTWQIEYELKYELDKIIEAKQLTNSLSWRITAPLRWVRSAMTPIWPRRRYQPPLGFG
jgi:hypothetical protein